MNKNTKIITGITLVVAILLIAVGYATITNVPLKISGNTTASPEQANFTVQFTGETTTSDDTKVIATVDEKDKLKANIDVTGLTAKGDTVTATYKIINKSADLSAALSSTETNSNTEYFEVSSDIADSTIASGEETTITVKVKLIKTPITSDETSNVTVTLDAQPQQP